MAIIEFEFSIQDTIFIMAHKIWQEMTTLQEQRWFECAHIYQSPN